MDGKAILKKWGFLNAALGAHCVNDAEIFSARLTLAKVP